MSQLTPFLIAFQQGIINKKPAKVYAHYIENKFFLSEGEFEIPILENENDPSEKHATNCHCELCSGYLLMQKDPAMYHSFRKIFNELIIQDEKRFYMSSADLSKLVIEYEKQRQLVINDS